MSDAHVGSCDESAAELAQLRAELAQLRQMYDGLARRLWVGDPQAAPARAGQPEHASVLAAATQAPSRREILGRFGRTAALGAGAIGVGMTLGAQPAAATAGVMHFGTGNDAGTDTTSLTSTSPAYTMSIDNACLQEGQTPHALQVTTVLGTGIEATSSLGSAAVHAVGGQGSGIPVLRAAVVAETNSPNQAAVLGAGKYVTGVYGLCRDRSGIPGVAAGVLGESSTAVGIVGMSATKAGVWGRGFRGGLFEGTKAAINLKPQTSAGHPSSGSAGDLLVDANHRLWFCKGGATWKQLA